MKPFLAIVAGFVLTLGVFGGGTAFGTFMLAGKSVQELRARVDAADVWTSEPRRVDMAAQDFERLPPQTVQPDLRLAEETSTVVAQADGEATADAETIDVTTTAALPPPDGYAALASDPDQTGHDREMPVELVEAHIDWCASRYRSYRPRDDSYTPYGGGRRPCVSPYSETLDAIMARFRRLLPFSRTRTVEWRRCWAMLRTTGGTPVSATTTSSVASADTAPTGRRTTAISPMAAARAVSAARPRVAAVLSDGMTSGRAGMPRRWRWFRPRRQDRAPAATGEVGRSSIRIVVGGEWRPNTGGCRRLDRLHHMRDARYRSFRWEDHVDQPHGGGPRRQCR